MPSKCINIVIITTSMFTVVSQLAPGTISLTDDRTQGDDSKPFAYSRSWQNYILCKLYFMNYVIVSTWYSFQNLLCLKPKPRWVSTYFLFGYTARMFKYTARILSNVSRFLIYTKKILHHFPAHISPIKRC